MSEAEPVHVAPAFFAKGGLADTSFSSRLVCHLSLALFRGFALHVVARS